MNTDPIDLPEDTSSEDSIRQLLHLSDVGERAVSVLEDCARRVLDIADQLIHARPDLVSFNRDPWKSPFLNTLFDQRSYLYLKRATYSDDHATLHMWEKGCKGDSDSAGEDITIPLCYLWLPHDVLTEQLRIRLDNLLEEHGRKLERQRLSSEAEERAKLAALKAKYEGGIRTD